MDAVHHDHALPKPRGDDERHGLGVSACEPDGPGCDGHGLSGLPWVNDNDSLRSLSEKLGLVFGRIEVQRLLSEKNRVLKLLFRKHLSW